jgi:hypothetical protein
MAETPPPRAAPAPAPTVLSGCQMKDTPETRELVAAAGRMLAAAPVSEEEGSKGRDGHDADVEAVIRDLASGRPLTCSVCLADNAKCVGAYEDPRDLRFACSGCCGHGNEDGWCVPLPAPAPPPSTGDGEPLWHLAAPGLRATCGSAAMNEVITTEAGEVTCPACRSASPSPSPRAQTAPADDRFDCLYGCGIGVKADEDGCCATCGRDCVIVRGTVPTYPPMDEPDEPRAQKGTEPASPCVGFDSDRKVGFTEKCCDRAGTYNGFGSDGPTIFSCPKGCACHD